MRRDEHITDSRHFFDWLKKSNDDIKAAKILKDNNGPNEISAFHCQQAIEKALKGYLLLKTKKHFDGHNLTFLCRQATKIDKKFNEWLDESYSLNRFYIETRYPTDTPIGLEDLRLEKIYNMAKEMYDFISAEIFGYEQIKR